MNLGLFLDSLWCVLVFSRDHGDRRHDGSPTDFWQLRGNRPSQW
jgi:hypothetical protein